MVRKKRVLTPLLRERRRLAKKLEDLAITPKELAAQCGVNPSTLTRVLWGDSEKSRALPVIIRAIQNKERRMKSRKSRFLLI